jgi:4,5-DOPA dioxygenase extradiol
MSGDARPFDWAIEFDAWVKGRIEQRDFSTLSRFNTIGHAALLSVPSPDHYVPLLYTAAVADPAEAITQIY